MLAAALGFIASSFITLRICFVSAVIAGVQLNSRLSLPAKIVFSIPSVSSGGRGAACDTKRDTHLELPFCSGVGICSS